MTVAHLADSIRAAPEPLVQLDALRYINRVAHPSVCAASIAVRQEFSHQNVEGFRHDHVSKDLCIAALLARLTRHLP
jgi:hypothetical protein